MLSIRLFKDFKGEKMLTDKEIKGLKPKADKKYLVADGAMMFVVVYPSGKKSFAFSYNDPKTRKLKRVILGQYPKMSLVEARNERVKLQFNLEKHNSIVEKTAANESFREICEKYLAQRNDVSPNTLKSCKARFDNYCAKILDYKIDRVEKADILDIFERMKLAKKPIVAKKLFSDLNNIFVYALNRDLIGVNPLASIIKKDIIYKKPVKHHATIVEQDKVKQLIGDILDTNANIYTKVAALMSLLTAQRSFSVRSAEWSEIDLDKGVWEIPAAKMKMKRPHIVYLNAPCVQILKSYKPLCDERLFESLHSRGEIMSDNTIRMMFRRMGYGNDDFTPHGFRFCAICHEHRGEHGLSSDIIELCLAHLDKNAVRASYNFASNLDERKRLFEWWGQYLCDLEPRLARFEVEFV